MADMATGYIMYSSELDQARTLAQQLQHALDSRVIVEQAAGILAERNHITASEAFDGSARTPGTTRAASTTSRHRSSTAHRPSRSSPGRILADEPVHRLANEVGVADVAGVLLDQVDQEAPQAG